MYVSTTAGITSKINIITENNVLCLIISNLIFSLLLSFIIDLYTFIPVTANASNAGIKIIFCINKLHVANIAPFPIANVATAWRYSISHTKSPKRYYAKHYRQPYYC